MNSQSLPNCLQSKEHSKFDLHAGPTEQFRNLLNRKNGISSQNTGIMSKHFLGINKGAKVLQSKWSLEGKKVVGDKLIWWV
jgi:hypothetical protein